ncbi:lytic polysaccharide monooxygenase [Spirilliplanes yamanashiensis]|uniref:lytic polysaccharide monooxygenase n=1 Tax=Spirilliplanes yamanashiensis TaxID=42233 RepID=UPI0027828157|nr:lytic polysaccharide monooxygenase [Spirilliplanes yamanashiensis]MDP9818033.1 chitin-binding protein [Spirilliplanes yamanashiensis]
MKTKKVILYPLASAAAVAATSLFAVTPASAHGYVSNPPSRQAQCAQGIVSGCGDVVYEPQSVEAPKGSMQCNGGGRFPVLNDNGKGWRATSVGSSATFNWVLTARHSTSTWEYFIGGTRIAVFDDGGRQPGATVSHNVNFGGRTGRQTVLARWNIADTAMAFYACVDLQIGGSGGNPPPVTNPPPTTRPPTNPPPTTQPPSQGGTWRAGTAYSTGSTVTYGGATYRCRQAHTALAGWEPPNVPALWERV